MFRSNSHDCNLLQSYKICLLSVPLQLEGSNTAPFLCLSKCKALLIDLLAEHSRGCTFFRVLICVVTKIWPFRACINPKTMIFQHLCSSLASFCGIAPEILVCAEELSRCNSVSLSGVPSKLFTSRLADNTLWLGNMAIRALRGSLEGRISSIIFSPNGQLLASASADNTVQLWGQKERGISRNPYG